MKPVRIVTDSTADIPAALAAELGIAVVPCQIYLGQEVYRDGVDLSPQAFYRKLGVSSKLPRTFRRLIAEGAGIISIHVAGNLSGTVNAAWAAAQTLSDPSHVEVVDSGQLSMGLGWAVIEAARMVQGGATRAEVNQAVRGMLPRLRAAAMIDTLENLYKGGRISQVTAMLGTALQVKPLLTIQDGHVEVVDRVRTRSRALKRLRAMVRGWGPLAEVAVLHTGAEGLAQELALLLSDLFPIERMIFASAGAALTTHLGLGAVGVCALVAAGG
jgi:DegV family protein with EDD domain